jgi:DNA-directed RNA polymerase specialized sigma24 family protein
LNNELNDTDAGDLIVKLTGYAIRVFAEYGLRGRSAVIPGIGKSPEDFAYEILEGYLKSEIKCKTFPYLCTALRNDITDKLRNFSHQTTEHMPTNPESDQDCEGGRSLDGFESGEARIDDYLCEKSYEDRVRACMAEEPPLLEVVEAVFDLDCLKPAEIGEALDVSAAEIQVRKKRLKRRLISVGIRGMSHEK